MSALGTLTRRTMTVLSLLLLLFAAMQGVRAQDAPGVVHLRLDGPVSPASASYIIGGIEAAAERGATLVVIGMDTPGGLDTSMRAIISAILASPVPVATFVGPAGARAASAGTYILYASHVAAMVPGTNLGAATPVAIGGRPSGEPEGSPDASAAKAVNDAVAYIRGLAELRDRNPDWAEAAVRDAESLTATAALQENVIDLTAATLEELLVAIDGRQVTAAGAQVTLQTAGAAVEMLEPDWRTRLLAIITNPNVAVVLMMIGFYGIIFEIASPGTLVPGTVGAISLIMGLYALAVLPISAAAFALMLLGAALIVAEAFVPSFGVLGVGGTIALVLGAGMLFDGTVPGMEPALPVLAGVAVSTLAVALLVARMAVVSRRQRVVTGRESLVNSEGVVLEWAGTGGFVHADGERWQAVGDGPLVPGQSVQITALRNLVLHVAPAPTTERNDR